MNDDSWDPLLAVPEPSQEIDDLPADDGAWLEPHDAHERIKSCSHWQVLGYIENLLEGRRAEEDDRRQALERKAVSLVGATALAFSASTFLGIQARPLVEALGGWRISAALLAAMAVLGALTALFGALAIRVVKTSTHSDNVVLNRPALGRLAHVARDSSDDEAYLYLVPFRQLVLCNLWTSVRDARLANDERARWVACGQWTFAAFILFLGVALFFLWTASAIFPPSVGLTDASTEDSHEREEAEPIGSERRPESRGSDRDTEIGATSSADAGNNQEEPGRRRHDAEVSRHRDGEEGTNTGQGQERGGPADRPDASAEAQDQPVAPAGTGYADRERAPQRQQGTP